MDSDLKLPSGAAMRMAISNGTLRPTLLEMRCPSRSEDFIYASMFGIPEVMDLSLDLVIIMSRRGQKPWAHAHEP